VHYCTEGATQYIGLDYPTRFFGKPENVNVFGTGAITLARQWARRCVALSPTHQAATALLRQLDLREAS
jgi:hypothetical protein